jgi:phage tail sheath protein FI
VAVVVVNVFDATNNTQTITDEVKTLVNGKCSLTKAPIGATLTIKNSSGSVIPVLKGTDYSIDDYGNFVSLTSRIGYSTTIKFTYKALDASTITANQIIGGIDSTSNIRTGLALFDLTFSTFGFTPKVFVSPFYIQLSAVSTQIASLANKFRAIYLQDAPYGTALGDVIKGRGNTTINFNTASRRAYLLYPYGNSYDKASGANADYPYSAFMAGLIAKNDNENGYWSSPSNKTIAILTSTEVPISYQINDAGCEANRLNEVGITTIVSGYGTGYKAYGNRSAAWPTDTDPRNFISLQRLDDIITESMELAVAADLDKPITSAFIRTMLAKGNTLMGNLIRQGAIQPGSKVVYNKVDNPAAQLAKGQIVFTRIYMGAPPAERVTFNNVIDITLLSKLG